MEGINLVAKESSSGAGSRRVQNKKTKPKKLLYLIEEPRDQMVSHCNESQALQIHLIHTSLHVHCIVHGLTSINTTKKLF